MAMNSPSSPIEATRNAAMMSGLMQARDRERTLEALDERERDRLAQEKLNLEFNELEIAPTRPGFFRRLLDRLPFA